MHPFKEATLSADLVSTPIYVHKRETFVAARSHVHAMPIPEQCDSIRHQHESQPCLTTKHSLSIYAAGQRHGLGVHVGDVIPRVTVQALLQPLLVNPVPNEASSASQHKEGVEAAHLDVLLRLFAGKSTLTIAGKVRRSPWMPETR